MLKTAHDAEEFMRTGARVSPSWPGGDLRGRIRCSRLISRRSRQNPLQTGRAIRFNSLLAETAKSADETILLTSETLADALRRVHPDIHAPERRELATQVTQQLLALQPFVFPAVKPKPPAPTAGHNTSFKVPTRNFEKPSRARYPCAECASVNPFDYCTTCRAEWVERRRKAQVLVNAKQRKWYADRRARSISGLVPRHRGFDSFDFGLI